MTEHEKKAAELYPYHTGQMVGSITNQILFSETVVDKQRAAWLSRQAEVDELKRQVEGWKFDAVKYGAMYAAKEKEHDAEMCAFGEWLRENASRNNAGSWVYFKNSFYTKTTTELLKQYRNDK
jgi:hypothetical protein